MFVTSTQSPLSVKAALLRRRGQPSDLGTFLNLHDEQTIQNTHNKVYAGALRIQMMIESPSFVSYIGSEGGNASQGVGEGAGSSKDEKKNPLSCSIEKEIVWKLDYLANQLGQSEEKDTAQEFKEQFQSLATRLRTEPHQKKELMNNLSNQLDLLFNWLENLSSSYQP